jgi:hypothetical protein
MRRKISARLDRRAFLNAFAAGAGLFGASRLFPGKAVANPASAAAGHDPDPSSLQPGQFFWGSDRAPEGQVVIIVSIPGQRVFVYRNAVLIGLSTCSTGKPGYSTPAGLFSVINKFKVHRSAKYGDDMPDTLRLTRKGVALHGGDVPGYPVSHGCVHLPLSFADQLFELAATGTPVVIGGHDDHHLVHGPGVTPASRAGKVVAAREAARSLVPPGPDADTTILVSAADRRLYAVQDGTIVAEGPAIIANPEEPLGTTMFVWRGGERGGAATIWRGGGFEPVPGVAVAHTKPLERLDSNAKLTGTLEKLLHSGTLLVTTDEALNPDQPRPPTRPKTRRKKRPTHARGHHRRKRSG